MILNGRLDSALLANVPGGRLDLAAAQSWIRLRADVLARFGFDLMPTSSVDTYRPYEVQERIFRQRYTTDRVTGIDPRRWLGQTWWRLPVYAAAAVPGTSNHGWGRAVDIASMGGFTSAKYRAVSTCAPAHGWDNNEGRSIAEPWHWTYKPQNDSRPSGGSPAIEEDPMSALSDDEQRRMLGALDTLATWLPSIKTNTDRLKHIQSQADTIAAATTNITNGVVQLLGRSSGLDTQAAAAAIADALDDNLAEAVIDRLTARLAG